MNIIETEKLSHGYWMADSFRRNDALRDLDLAVPAGSVFALLGANGAGKSTTIKLLMNLLRPRSGAARVLGVDSRRLGRRELAQIGYVSENQQLPLWMSTRQLLDFCRPFYPAWDAALEKELLLQFGLPEDRKLGQLSRGMLMKAALLSVLAYRPKLLVLDEPFSGLDPLVRDEFVRGVLEISSLGEWTVLVSSHDIEDIERLADRVGLLEHGRLALNESVEALQWRFRRVEVTDAGFETGPAPGALEWERSAHLTRFVATDYAGEATEAAWRERYPTGRVKATPMSLREIFITLARAGRSTPKGAAA